MCKKDKGKFVANNLFLYICSIINNSNNEI